MTQLYFATLSWVNTKYSSLGIEKTSDSFQSNVDSLTETFLVVCLQKYYLLDTVGTQKEIKHLIFFP